MRKRQNRFILFTHTSYKPAVFQVRNFTTIRLSTNIVTNIRMYIFETNAPSIGLNIDSLTKIMAPCISILHLTLENFHNQNELHHLICL